MDRAWCKEVGVFDTTSPSLPVVTCSAFKIEFDNAAGEDSGSGQSYDATLSRLPMASILETA